MQGDGYTPFLFAITVLQLLCSGLDYGGIHTHYCGSSELPLELTCSELNQQRSTVTICEASSCVVDSIAIKGFIGC